MSHKPLITGPLRTITGSRINEYGWIIELLDCGHEYIVSRLVHKDTKQRRCPTCLKARKPQRTVK